MTPTLMNINLPADMWVNLYEVQSVIDSGISVGQQLVITHIKGEVDLNFNPTKPLQDDGFVPLPASGFKNNSVEGLGAWAISRGRSGLINVNTVDGLIQKAESLANPRMLTSPLSLSDLLTAEGLKFQSTIVTTPLGGAVEYVLYQMPSIESGVVVALQERRYKSESGASDLEVLWDSTDIVINGSPLPTFNENRNSNKVAQMVISSLTSTTDGIVRELDFIAGSGTGNNTSGGISEGSGFRLYSPDSNFITKLTNKHNSANRTIVAYTWVEIPVEWLALA